MRYLLRYLLRREAAYILVTITAAILYALFGSHLGLHHGR